MIKMGTKGQKWSNRETYIGATDWNTISQRQCRHLCKSGNGDFSTIGQWEGKMRKLTMVGAMGSDLCRYEFSTTLSAYST